MEYIVEAQGLRKTYGAVQALRGVSLRVQRGEVVGVLGANGAGKSTLIECILGVRKPDAGEIRLLGMHPERERKRLFAQVGVQFQQSAVQERIRVGELCQMTAALYPQTTPAAPLLAQFGLAGKLRQQVSDLSGGERQKLFIVLALLPMPQLVFLDELTTGLDARARRDVWQCLKQQKAQGLTIVLTSHFMDEVEALCDRVLILWHGQTHFEGTVQQAVAATPHQRLEDAYLWLTDDEREDNA